ncbi:MAG: efflux RND transporter permease subunit, partial [Myxococcales bacterium]|nr:efflux RND transporter permease subunit [Myxococcales bacterium]
QVLVDRFYTPIETLYLRALAFCLRHRWVVVVASALSLATLPMLAGVAKKGFLPIDDQGQFEVTVRAPEGMSLAATSIHGERVARQLRELPGVVGTLVTVGTNDQAAENVAQVYVRLSDPRAREASQEDIKDVVRKQVIPTLDPTLRVAVNDIAAIGGGGQSTARIQYNLLG